MKSTRYLLLSLTCLLLTPPVTVTAAKGKSPWYQVEIILFSRDSGNRDSDEQWPQEPEAPEWNGAWQLSRAGYSDGNYPLLPRSNWQLGADEYALKRKGRVMPLIHVAWRQPVLSRNGAHSVYLASAQQTTTGEPVMEGLVRIGVARFLHLDLDFLLRRRPLQTGDEADTAIPGTTRSFRFTAHRRMRSKELHYIDHPLMGALVLITPIQTAAATEEDPTAPTNTVPENGQEQ